MKRTTITTFELSKSEIVEAIRFWLQNGEGILVDSIYFVIDQDKDGDYVLSGAICKKEHKKDE